MTYSASVVGGGFGGQLSLDALVASSQYRLLAVADSDPQVRQALTSRYPDVKIFGNHLEMFEACPSQVIGVATPTPTHYRISRDALAQEPLGLIVEKPMAASAKEAADLLEDLKRRDVPLVVPHGMFALPAPRRVLELVRNGGLGSLKSIEIQNSVDLLNAGIHWLTFVLALLEGDPVENVLSACDTEGCLVNDGMQVETRGVTCFRTEAGVSITLQSGQGTSVHSDCIPEDQRRGALFRLIGSAGHAELHAWGGCYWLLDASHPSGEVVQCEANDGSPHLAFLESLARQIREQCADYTIPQRSLAGLELIEAAYRSSQSQCAMQLSDGSLPDSHRSRWRPGQPAAGTT